MYELNKKDVNNASVNNTFNLEDYNETNILYVLLIKYMI